MPYRIEYDWARLDPPSSAKTFGSTTSGPFDTLLQVRNDIRNKVDNVTSFADLYKARVTVIRVP